MDLSVDPNAKYTIMRRKIVLVPENDEDLTHSGLGNTFTYNENIFSGTSETMMRRPFNICNHYSLLQIPLQFCQLLAQLDDYVNHNILLNHDTWVSVAKLPFL